jgi:PAS domain S-box-containing protein
MEKNLQFEKKGIHEISTCKDIWSNEDLFRLVTENATTGLFIMDEKQHCTFLNPAAEKIIGYSLEEIRNLNKPLHDIIHYKKPCGELYPIHECPIDSVFPTENQTQGEDLFVKPDGSFYPVAFTASPIVKSGKTLGTIIEIRDITDEKKKEEDLKKSELEFRLMADNIQNLAWMANADGWIYWYNKRWYDYTGTHLEEMKGWGWDKVHHPEHVYRVVSFVKTAWKKGEPWELTFPLRSCNGNYRWFLTRAIPVKDNKGKVLSWVGTSTDIDDQQRALENKDEFIGIASHELKTPLTGIKAFLQISEAKLQDGEYQLVDNFIRKAGAGVLKLEGLINELLDISKIQAGKMQYTFAKLYVRDVVDDCTEQMLHQYKTHTISVEGDLDVEFEGDKFRLEQVVSNLLTNAIKYSPNSKKVVLKVKRAGEKVHFCISDFGIGIPKEKTDSIFERFFRIEKDSKNFSGLGLGLYITKEIILRHKGEIWVESEPEKGSDFHFMIPLMQEAQV